MANIETLLWLFVNFWCPIINILRISTSSQDKMTHVNHDRTTPNIGFISKNVCMFRLYWTQRGLLAGITSCLFGILHGKRCEPTFKIFHKGDGCILNCWARRPYGVFNIGSYGSNNLIRLAHTLILCFYDPTEPLLLNLTHKLRIVFHCCHFWIVFIVITFRQRHSLLYAHCVNEMKDFFGK